MTGVEICKPGLKDISDTDVDSSYAPKRISKNNPNYQPDQALHLVSKYIDFQSAKALSEHTIPWATVAGKVKTKSRDACRNRWNTQVHNMIHSEDTYTSKQTQKLIEGIRNQDVDYEQEIDFAEIENGHTAEENKHQWERLKKLVTSRCMASVSRVLADLVEYMRENKAEGPRYRIVGDKDDGETAVKAEDIGQKSLWDMYHQRIKALK